MALAPGQIYFADFNGGHRPVIIISRETLNLGRYVLAIPLTSTNFEVRSKQRNCVPFQAGDFGLPKDCVAQAEAVSFIEIAALDVAEGPVGTLDDAAMRSLIKAVGFVISSDCEPE